MGLRVAEGGADIGAAEFVEKVQALRVGVARPGDFALQGDAVLPHVDPDAGADDGVLLAFVDGRDIEALADRPRGVEQAAEHFEVEVGTLQRPQRDVGCGAPVVLVPGLGPALEADDAVAVDIAAGNPDGVVDEAGVERDAASRHRAVHQGVEAVDGDIAEAGRAEHRAVAVVDRAEAARQVELGPVRAQRGEIVVGADQFAVERRRPVAALSREGAGGAIILAPVSGFEIVGGRLLAALETQAQRVLEAGAGLDPVEDFAGRHAEAAGVHRRAAGAVDDDDLEPVRCPCERHVDEDGVRVEARKRVDLDPVDIDIDRFGRRRGDRHLDQRCAQDRVVLGPRRSRRYGNRQHSEEYRQHAESVPPQGQAVHRSPDLGASTSIDSITFRRLSTFEGIGTVYFVDSSLVHVRFRSLQTEKNRMDCISPSRPV